MATAKKSTKTAKTSKTTKATKTTKAPKTVKTTPKTTKATKKVEKKTSKKFFIGIIIAAIIAVLAASGFFIYTKFFAAPNISGTYELTGMESDGEDQSDSITVLKGLGLKATLELKEDKTGKLDLFGDSSDITYDKEKINIDGNAAGYSYKDGTLTIEENGTKLIFTINR